MNDLERASTPSNTNDYLLQNIGLVKFVLVALVVYGITMTVYTMLIIGADWFAKYLELNAALASKFLTHVIGETSYIQYSEAGIKTAIHVEHNGYVTVNQDSVASFVIAALVAALLAWPSKIWLRAAIALAGFLFLFVLNILRIAGLMLTEVYLHFHFDLMQVWLLPAGLILGAALFFYSWTRKSGTHPLD